MRKIQTQNDNPMTSINNRNKSCDRIQLSYWLFEQMFILKRKDKRPCFKLNLFLTNLFHGKR